MKKFLLFVSTVIISLLFINNKTFAQEYPNYPSHLMKASYYPYVLYPIAENDNTYEYELTYDINVVIYDINEIEYFLIAENVLFKKGIDRRTNSYEIIGITPYPDHGDTVIELHVTLLKSVVDEYEEDNFPLDPTPLFRYYSALYVTYISDTGSIDYDTGYQNGYDDGLQVGEQVGYDNGYNEGYNDGYNDGLNNFNVADYFGTQNIAKAPDITYAGVSDLLEPSTSIILINKGYADPNILLDKPYLLVVIKKNIYNHVTVRFDDNSLIYHYEAIYHDINDYDIYVFDFSERINTKYRLEIRKENVTTSEQANKFLNDVKDNLYFSHATKLLNSSIASQFYHFGYLVGLEENISSNDAYRIGYEQGFERGKTLEYEDGYNDGYNVGYDDGLKASTSKFTSNLHVWLVPAIIIVVIAGIFVGYRRERYDSD